MNAVSTNIGAPTVRLLSIQDGSYSVVPTDAIQFLVLTLTRVFNSLISYKLYYILHIGFSWIQTCPPPEEDVPSASVVRV